jgi:hypothetical protein
MRRPSIKKSVYKVTRSQGKHHFCKLEDNSGDNDVKEDDLLKETEGDSSKKTKDQELNEVKVPKIVQKVCKKSTNRLQDITSIVCTNSDRPKRKKQPPAKFCEPEQIAKKAKVAKNQDIPHVQQSNSIEKLEIIHDDIFTEGNKVKAKKNQCESCGKKFNSKDNYNHIYLYITKKVMAIRYAKFALKLS